MPLSTWLGLTDEPGVLDGHGPIPGALARQIAADAARDHPQTTTWRCVVVDDRHRTVLGVGDLIPTPRHDPPPRVARLIATAEPTCVYPGCPTPAHRCDLDHRIPHERGGATCACNVQPLCRRHHRLKGTGAVTVRPAPPGSDVPPGTLTWTSWTGRSYEHRPPEAAVLPARPSDRAHAATVDSERRFERTLHALAEDADADEPLTEEWTRSRRRQHEQDERQQNGRAARTARASRRPRPSADQQPDDDVPPF